MAVKYLDNAGTQYLVNKIKAIDGKIPTESQITTMITTALNTYKEGIVTIVESLPQTGEEGKLYLVLDPSDSDVYIIYTWEANAFKRMGSKTFTLTVDSALSASSTNPVQNKVVKTALDGKANSSHTHGSITNDGKLGTASRVVITGTDKKIGISTVTTTELGYLSGVTSSIQTQLDGKSATGHTHTAGDVAGLATVATSGSYNDLSNKPSIPIKISDLQDDVDMLTSHEDLHLENLPNDSPNIRFINNSPQITWNEHVYYDPATTLISGPSYEFDDETSLTSKSKIGYTNSSNSQNTVEHIYGQTYGATKAFFTMKYYYGSNEKNAEEDESCTINSSLVFTLDPNYESAGADTYYDESNAQSDVSPNNTNYHLGALRPFNSLHVNDVYCDNINQISFNGVLQALTSFGTHTEDTDIHVTASDKTTWNAVSSKANDSDVVHKSGDETVGGVKTFSDNPVIGNNNTNITISNRQITANGSYSAPTGSSYSFMQLRANVNYADSSPSIGATVGLSIQENAYSDGKRAGFNPNSNNTINLGLAGKRWANVYATNYYYGGSEIEFSTKFVTTDTAQTISGQKVFDDINTMSSSSEIGVSGGNRSYKVLDKNKKILAKIEGGTYSSGMAYSYWLANNGSDVFNGVSLYQPSASLAQLRPYDSTLSVQLGASNRYFSDCYTSKINGLTPSSLGMPDLNNVVDISGYITDLAGAPNVYSAPANGYIVLRSTTANVLGIVENTTGMGTYSRGSNQVLAVNLPVVKNSSISIYAICSSLTQAKFIPCQGNV